MIAEVEGLAAAEEAVLGAILIRPELLGEIKLDCYDFSSIRHRDIFLAMRNLEAAGAAIDITTLCAQLERQGRLDGLAVLEGQTGRQYLATLALNVECVEHVQDYAKLVADESVKRQVALAAGEAVDKFRRGTVGGKELLDSLMAALTRIDADGTSDNTATIRELGDEHVKKLQAVFERQGPQSYLTGFPTGVVGLDEKIGGWQPGIVSIVCARPGMGKSTMLLATTDACSSAGIGVHVFSMEDPRFAYMNRAFARRSSIPMQRLQTGQLKRDLGDFTNFVTAHHNLARTPRSWLVDDRSGISADEIIRSVRRHQRENGTKVVIVDYLQLMRAGSRTRSGGNKHEQIGDTINELADAAKNDGMAYIVGSQLNRGAANRDDMRPRPSDLRESGTIEERAKCIIGMYRGKALYPNPRDGIDVDDNGATLSQEMFEGSVQLLVLKNSQGPAPDRVLANFTGEDSRVWTGDFK